MYCDAARGTELNHNYGILQSYINRLKEIGTLATDKFLYRNKNTV